MKIHKVVKVRDGKGGIPFIFKIRLYVFFSLSHQSPGETLIGVNVFGF